MLTGCRIFTIPKLGEKLKQDTLPLTYTPRKFISNPYFNVFYMIESDHRTYGPASVKRILGEKVGSVRPRCDSVAPLRLLISAQEAAGDRIDKTVLDLPPNEFGRIRAPAGKWASLIRVLDPLSVSHCSITPPVDFSPVLIKTERITFYS